MILLCLQQFLGERKGEERQVIMHGLGARAFSQVAQAAFDERDDALNFVIAGGGTHGKVETGDVYCDGARRSHDRQLMVEGMGAARGRDPRIDIAPRPRNADFDALRAWGAFYQDSAALVHGGQNEQTPTRRLAFVLEATRTRFELVYSP